MHAHIREGKNLYRYQYQLGNSLLYLQWYGHICKTYWCCVWFVKVAGSNMGQKCILVMTNFVWNEYLLPKFGGFPCTKDRFVFKTESVDKMLMQTNTWIWYSIGITYMSFYYTDWRTRVAMAFEFSDISPSRIISSTSVDYPLTWRMVIYFN